VPYSHATAAAANRGRLGVVFGLTLAIFLVEIVGGLISSSLALLADAGHMFTDVAGIGLALPAIWFAGRPASGGRTFGYLRLEILAAVVNAVLLFGVSGFVLFEAWRRLSEPPEIVTFLMLAVALIGLVANAVSLFLLRNAQGESLNMRGAYLEVAGDFAGSAAVIVAAIVIATTRWTPADAVASALIGLHIIPRTWRLLRDAIDILWRPRPRESTSTRSGRTSCEPGAWRTFTTSTLGRLHPG
jgi:cobalt-zinc-cadmium efflux system protein